MAVGERTARRSDAAARGQCGAVVYAAVGPLLVLEVDPPHPPFEIGEEPGEALLVAPDVRTGRLAAAVRAFPAVDVAVGHPKHHADVTNRGRLRRDAIQASSREACCRRRSCGTTSVRRRTSGNWRPPRGSPPWRRARASHNGSPSSVIVQAEATVGRLLYLFG